MSRQTPRRTANLFAAALSLVVASRCNVYNDSLLGRDELTVGGTATMPHSGASGTAAGEMERGGTGGKSEGESGTANSNMGGLAEMAGAIESGGAETSGGSAGSVNTGGSIGGTSSIGGAGGKGTTGGASAGSSGSAAGAGGLIQTAKGCAKLSVPLDDASDKAHFVITLASNTDLSGATISMRFYVQAAQGGTIFNYVQDSGTYHFLGVPEAKRQTLSSANAWATMSWNVGTEPDAAGTGIVKTSIKSIGIEINSQPSSTWSNPTVVYVDSVTVTTPTLSFTFDGSSSVATSSTSGALWLNSGSSDTTATGTALTWQAACP